MGEHQGVEGQDEKGEQHQPGVHVYKGRTTEVGEKSSEWYYTLLTMTILRQLHNLNAKQENSNPSRFKKLH